MTMMRRRGGGSLTATCSDDVEICSPSRHESSPLRSNRRRRSSKSCGRMLAKRLVVLCIFVTTAIFGWNYFQRAYTLYNLPGVKELLNAAPRVLGDDHIVFLTASTGEEGETYIEIGRSQRSPSYALMQAQSKLPKKFHAWIKIDIVDGIERIEDFDYFDVIKAPGNFFGIALDWELGWAFLPEEVQAHGLMGKDQILRWEKLLSYARSKKLKGWPVPDKYDDSTQMDDIDVFHTQSIFYDLSAGELKAIPVYHGHRMYDALSPDIVSEATIDAGEYLALNVDEDGTMVYEYHPRSGYKASGSNLSLHATALYAMSYLYSRWQDPELLQRIKYAMEHLIKYVQSCQVPNNPGLYAKCVVETDEINKVSRLGSNALAVLAIAEYMEATKDQTYFKIAKDLSIYIGGSTREDGSFVHMVHLPDFKIDDDYFVRFYHGQASFALSRLYNVARRLGMPVDEQWVEVAVNATVYPVSQGEGEEDDEFVIDQWLNHAIGQLPKSKVSSIMIDHAMRSVLIAVDNQNGEIEDEEALDEVGIFFGDLSATTTATITEGLCAVYHLAVEQGRHKEADMIVKAVTLGLRHQLQTQYQPEHAMYMRNPNRILGGFHESIIGTEMRIDCTYHNLCSLLCATEMLADREKRTEPIE